jgi:hypothetical protein
MPAGVIGVIVDQGKHGKLHFHSSVCSIETNPSVMTLVKSTW